MSAKNTGTVKWFSTQKGFGFILPDTGGSDIFVHIKGLACDSIREGDKVAYDLSPDRQNRMNAVNVTKKAA